MEDLIIYILWADLMEQNICSCWLISYKYVLSIYVLILWSIILRIIIALLYFNWKLYYLKSFDI